LSKRRPFSRVDRLQSELRKIVDTCLIFECQIEEVKNISVTHVNLTKDLSILKLYISHTEVHSDKEILKVCDSVKGKLKNAIAKNIRMRKIPELHFQIDNQLKEAERIDQLINSISR